MPRYMAALKRHGKARGGNRAYMAGCPSFCATSAPATTPRCRAAGCRCWWAASAVGWLEPDLGARAAGARARPRRGAVELRSAQLQPIARRWRRRGRSAGAPRRSTCAASRDGTVAGPDRPWRAARCSGSQAAGVHVNGLVEEAARPGSGWRAGRPTSALDPRQARPSRRGRGAGRAHAGETLLKEAEEEAGPAAGAGRRPPRGHHRLRDAAHGGAAPRPAPLLRLRAAGSVQPGTVDGEVEGFELWPLARVLDDRPRRRTRQVQRQSGPDRLIPAARLGGWKDAAALRAACRDDEPHASAGPLAPPPNMPHPACGEQRMDAGPARNAAAAATSGAALQPVLRTKL